MTKTKYGIEKATSSLPARDLLRVLHRNRDFVVSSPAFGPNTYSNNLEEMSRDYSHSRNLPKISFKEPTTSESISAAAYKFAGMAKPEIFDKSWLQAGRIARTSEGVFVNPPKDSEGNSVTDEQTLKSHLEGSRKVNGIYLLDNDFGFAPYDTFETGVQDSGDFAEGGLARALEHSKGKAARNLKEISSEKNYKRGVNVWGFDPVSEPILSVAGLGSYGDTGGDRLDVDGDWSGGDGGGGCVFGVLNSGEASAPKNSE